MQSYNLVINLKILFQFFSYKFHSNARTILFTHFIFVFFSAVTVLINSFIHIYYFYIKLIFVSDDGQTVSLKSVSFFGYLLAQDDMPEVYGLLGNR